MMLNDYTGNEAVHSGDNVATLEFGRSCLHLYRYAEGIEINYDNAGIVVKNGTVNAQKPLDTAGVSMLYNNGVFTMENVTMTVPGDSSGHRHQRHKRGQYHRVEGFHPQCARRPGHLLPVHRLGDHR